MSDQTPDPTAWSDDQLDDLLDRLAERAEQRDDLDLPGGGASRRGVLAGLLGLGGAAAGAGVASAIGENENYSASTGVVGTDSEPLSEANVQDLHAQDAQVDNSLEADQLGLPNVTILTKDLSLEGASNKPIFSVDNVEGGAAGEITVAGDEFSRDRGGFDKVFYSHDKLEIDEKMPKGDFLTSFQLSIDGKTVEFTDPDGATGEVTIIALIAGPRDDFEFLV